MMKKYLFNLMMLMALAVVAVSCSSNDEPTEADYVSNAENVFGVKIDPNQDWKMSQSVTANISVNGVQTGEVFHVAVYSNDPLTDGEGVVLTKGTVEDGGSFVSTFCCAIGVDALYVGITDESNYTLYKKGTLENGTLNVSFGMATSTSAQRRAITVNGDVYDAFNFPSSDEISSAFPKSIPDSADEVSDLETLYKGKECKDAQGNTQKLHDLYHIYAYKITEGYNLKITKSGEVSLGGTYQNVKDNVACPYNVYVKVNGDVTIKRSGATHFNLYILQGNVTFESNYGQQAGIISVADGCVLNDQRTSIAANQGVKIYNRGTVNATAQSYDIGNNCTVYNEGTFNISGAMSYSPGAGNTSYFINKSDDARLTASSMTLNSTCHFYNDGRAVISGETNVTQSDIFWINNGYYSTGTMKFSAGNSTYYNYCQLLVSKDAVFKDGSFNMMANSYAKIGAAAFNNFFINMGDNSMVNILNGSAFGQQGQGTKQGFYANDDQTTAYVRLGGETKIPAHNGSAFHASGAGLTLACKSVTFYEGCYIGDSYSGSNFWNETTEQKLKDNSDGRSVWNLHNANQASFTDFEITDPAVNECSATWVKAGQQKNEVSQVYTYAFEDTKMGDYDMNDVVIQVWEDPDHSDSLKVKLCCTGAAYDLYVWFNNDRLFGGNEVHAALGGTAGKFINTGSGSEKFETRDPVTTTINKPADFSFDTANFYIETPVFYIYWTTTIGDVSQINNNSGKAPYGVMIPEKWAWPKEWVPITSAYENFDKFANNRNNHKDWYYSPISGMTYSY